MYIKKRQFKILILIVLMSISVVGVSQNRDTLAQQKFFYGIKTGVNLSKLHSDSIDFNYGAHPLFGLYGKLQIANKLFLNTAVLYSLKGSSLGLSVLKVENNLFDFESLLQYEVSKSIFLQSGISYSSLLSSKKLVINGESKNGIERKEINGYSSEISIPIGIEFNLQENVNLEFNYFIPTSKNNTKNFQFSLNILLNNKRKSASARKRKQDVSKTQITKLKSGPLLVRLKTSENKIKALKKAGMLEKAANLEKEQYIENNKIVKAFKDNFNFCKVAFFYSNASNKVLNKHFNGILLNDSLKIDNSIKIDTSGSFFIAEFGNIEQDTTKYFSHYTYEPDNRCGIKKVPNYYTSSSNIDFHALIIRDAHFVQLKKPFPYYARAIHMSMRKHPEQMLFIPPIYLFMLTWTYDGTVDRMNKNLHWYYNKSK